MSLKVGNKFAENKFAAFFAGNFEAKRLRISWLIITSFSNMAAPNIISGNLAASVSDYLPQFLVAPYIFSQLIISPIQ